MESKSVLVVAAHPDDEVLGCGGTIAKHRAQGHRVEVLIMAEGITSRDSSADGAAAAELTSLREAAHKANNVLGVNLLTMLAYPDNRMDSVVLLEIVKDIEVLVQRLQPSTVYTHHANDVNIDHRRIHDAVIAACRPQPGHCVKQLLFFETPSSTEWRPPSSLPPFAPDWFVDISKTLDLKLDALQAYHGEMREFPHPRSVKACEHLARWRGASVGIEAAEAFAVGRIIS